MSDQGLTIAQAAKVLGVSPKTIRRHIKDGKIPYVLAPGKYGEEYRILELPNIIEGETMASTSTRDSLDVGKSTLESNPPLDDSPGLDTTSNLALDIINDLQKTNLQLAAQLGAAQERIRELESQVRLLTTRREPWWRRALKKLGIQ